MKIYKAIFTGCILSDKELRKLKSKGIEVKPEKADLTEKELIKALKDVEIYMMGGNDKATAKVIKSAKKLKLIAFCGAGYESYIDTATAHRRKIHVTYTPQANAPTVAEHTVALALDAVKQITDLNESTKKGQWKARRTWNLKNKTLGIIGMGAIGTIVARILYKGFSMKILYTSTTRKISLEKELNAKKVILSELLKKADIISVNATFSDKTVGMIGRNELNLVKPSSILVNTARPELVEAKALFEALKNKKIACAAFDGYYKEPPSKQDNFKLLDFPNDKFIITPHTAYNSSDAIRAMSKMMIDSIQDFIQGKKPRHLVDKY